MAVVARIPGTVEVGVTVKDGQVVNTEVKSSPPGPEILKRATIENMQTWRFYKIETGTFTPTFIYKVETKHRRDQREPQRERRRPVRARHNGKHVGTCAPQRTC